MPDADRMALQTLMEIFIYYGLYVIVLGGYHGGNYKENCRLGSYAL
jgi:hypothetical protein